MTDSLTDRIRALVHQRGPLSASAVVDSIPELAAAGGEARALLLMRLDPQLEPRPGCLWAARGLIAPEKSRIKQAAMDYFQSLGREGAPFSSLVKSIATTTGIEAAQVKKILSELFIVHGSNIFNRLKSQEGK